MIRIVRLYQSKKGIWHMEIERNGLLRWSSLRTRDEAKAKATFERLKEFYKLMEENPP